ncbi:MAG: hypothetical protein DHS20C09_13820 [marine bacterium B5-7]|nr:MAG: hypothetical protein DHS20C09_13820 [marine bacterium B5-7]
MRFETKNNQVKCIRTIIESSGDSKETVIVTFDAHLHEVAPHVMASLSANEQQELKHWLDDRTILLDRSVREVILYALPGLLNESRDAIDKLPTISTDLHQELSTAITSFSETLVANQERSAESRNKPYLKHMTSSDALKEILGILKKSL